MWRSVVNWFKGILRAFKEGLRARKEMKSLINRLNGKAGEKAIKQLSAPKEWKGGSQEVSEREFDGAYLVGKCPACGKRIWSTDTTHTCSKKGRIKKKLEYWFRTDMWRSPSWQRPFAVYPTSIKSQKEGAPKKVKKFFRWGKEVMA